ncbi:MAG: hypothetical protein LUD19_03470 [Clostridia bacterium]|nr:hypothetical protein [Clostridia bacterium]
MATKKTTKTNAEAEYTVEEFTANAAAVFGTAVSPDIVKTALRLAGVTTTTKSAAVKIIKEFQKKEVK